jgi:hypothetical protein
MNKIFLIFVCLANSVWAEGSIEPSQRTLETVSNVPEIVWDSGIWLSKRIPNAQEILFDSGLETVFDLALGEYTRQLGHNPSAKSVLRDAIKLPSAIAKAEAGTRVGGTKYVFDQSHVFSQISKTTLKLAGTVLLSKGLGMEPKEAAVWANYPGDIVARYFVKAGQYRQNANSTDPIPTYIWENAEGSWAGESISETLPKIVVANSVGSLIERASVGSRVRGGVIHILNHFRSDKINPSQTLFANAKGWKSYPITFLCMATAFFAEKTVLTYLLAPASRITMDGITAGWDWWKSKSELPIQEELVDESMDELAIPEARHPIN